MVATFISGWDLVAEELTTGCNTNGEHLKDSSSALTLHLSSPVLRCHYDGMLIPLALASPYPMNPRSAGQEACSILCCSDPSL
ncbi:hypothetical protein SKAU_G00162500 [Synaphobranchus kaupii]|uniref:Uncharacterized protein n=1 Tax=Synaphobranchus kaupii TaxID=118154 RepID=A0A9Q1FIT1_SYNKA|nr:hypothetical protein SKAU_G00162500 [Synaphobranchus kaupii]